MARLRRTFHYPSSRASASHSDSDSQPEAIDEQEQEALIARLAAQNTARDDRFRRLLVALPLLLALAYLPCLARPPAPADRLAAVVALSSLLATAYLLVRLPPTLTGVAPLDRCSRRRHAAALPSRRRRLSQLRPALLASPAASSSSSPLETYLPYLNAGLVAVLVLMGLAKGRASGGCGSLAMSTLPAIVYGLVLAAKMVMGSVDPEAELSALKYEYKGA